MDFRLRSNLALLSLLASFAACAPAASRGLPTIPGKSVGAGPPRSVLVGASDEYDDADLDESPSLRRLARLLEASEAIPRGDFEAPDVLLVAYEPDWPEALGSLVEAAREHTQVLVVVGPDRMDEPEFLEWHRKHPVELFRHPVDSGWIRDYGPLALKEPDGTPRWLDLHYHEDRPLDDAVPEALGSWAGVRTEPAPLEVEGGGLISDGRGWCVMTEASLGETGVVEDGANSTPEERRYVRRLLGCRQLTLVPALLREQTGHVDVMAQFLAPDVLALAEMSHDPADGDNATLLDEAADTIAAAARRLGRPLRIVRVPLFARDTVFYSYINGTRLPEAFLVPHYPQLDERLEQEAHRTLRSALPADVELLPVDAGAMVSEGGAIHCITLGLDLPQEKPLVAEPALPPAQPLPRAARQPVALPEKVWNRADKSVGFFGTRFASTVVTGKHMATQRKTTEAVR